jgi:hypothetical protein
MERLLRMYNHDNGGTWLSVYVTRAESASVMNKSLLESSVYSLISFVLLILLGYILSNTRILFSGL